MSPGFPETIYHNVLIILLEVEKIKFQTKKEYNVIFHLKNSSKFRGDLSVEEKVVVEFKSNYIYQKKFNKLEAYLKTTRLKTGLLAN